MLWGLWEGGRFRKRVLVRVCIFADSAKLGLGAPLEILEGYVQTAAADWMFRLSFYFLPIK